jgi:hypothetical protein
MRRGPTSRTTIRRRLRLGTVVAVALAVGACVAPVTEAAAAQPPTIGQPGTYRDGVLVWLVLPYADPDNDATGFGFRGANGSGWAEESHPFSSPSFGRVFSNRLEYPFNHACGTSSEIDSYVEAWIYDRTGLRSGSVLVHLTCAGQPAPVQQDRTPDPTFVCITGPGGAPGPECQRPAQERPAPQLSPSEERNLVAACAQAVPEAIADAIADKAVEAIVVGTGGPVNPESVKLWLTWQSIGIAKAGSDINVDLRYANGKVTTTTFTYARIALRVAQQLPGAPAALGITAAASYCLEWAFKRTGEAGASVGNYLREELNKRFGWQDGKAVKDALTRAFTAGHATFIQVRIWGPQAGTLTAEVLRRPGARARQAARQVTLATGWVTFARPGRKRMKLKMTKLGKRLFRRERRLQVSVAIRFKPRFGTRRLVARHRATLRR